MACAIHHGGGVGTYKTFSVLQRHAIPQLESGRVVISTIRGFDSIRVIEAVLELEIPKESSIQFVDLETTDGIEKIRRWWEWVPKGAYVIIDEAQLIYPKAKRIASYDYPARDGMTSDEAAKKDDKPNGFLQAFTMQRHYNWDLVIITPNVNMLVPEIRQVSQIAYEHKYLGGVAPWLKHGWREIQHSPTETGKSSAHPPIRYNADKRIYKVYKSTKTGNHSSGNAELSMFKNPKLIFFLSLSVLSIVTLVWLLSTRVFGEGGTLSLSKNQPDNVKVFDNAHFDNGVDSDDSKVSRVQSNLAVPAGNIETTQFHSKTMAIVGKFFDEYTIEVGIPPNAVQFSTGQLFRNGVKLKVVSDCLIELTFDEITYNVRCPLHLRKFESIDRDNEIKLTPFGALTGA